MQKYLALALFAFSGFSTASAAMMANCTNENTFLKINEVRTEKSGQRIAELFVNFKDLNRILNLPEVTIKQFPQGLVVKESDGNTTVILMFTEVAEDQNSEPQKVVTISIKLEGIKVRQNIKLKCEK